MSNSAKQYRFVVSAPSERLVTKPASFHKPSFKRTLPPPPPLQQTRSRTHPSRRVAFLHPSRSYRGMEVPARTRARFHCCEEAAQVGQGSKFRSPPARNMSLTESREETSWKQRAFPLTYKREDLLLMEQPSEDIFSGWVQNPREEGCNSSGRVGLDGSFEWSSPVVRHTQTLCLP